MTEEETYSASSVSDYLLCARKWGWRKLDHVTLPGNQYALFGIEGHRQAESYLKDNIPLDLTTEHGQAAIVGMHHWPRPGTPGLQVEERFEIDIQGFLFVGYMDIRVGDVVYDHKFTSDFKYAKTSAELLTNIQAVIYAWVVLQDHPMAALKWLYYRRKPPHRCHPVTVTFQKEDCLPTIQLITKAAAEMRAIRRAGLKSKDLPYNPAACDVYGGCSYQHLCQLSPRERFSAQMSIDQGKADFINSLTAINPPPNGAPPPRAAMPVSPDGKQQWDGTAWQPIQAAPPPPPPPPVQAAPPPPPPAVVARPVSPDGKLEYDGTAWVPIAPVQAAPPPPPEPAKRGPGRPPKQPPAPGDASVQELVAQALEAAARSLRG